MATGMRVRSEGTEAQQEARRNRLKAELLGAKLKLAGAVGKQQRLFWISKVAEIELEM